MRRKLFSMLKDKFIKYFFSRIFVLTLVTLTLGSILTYRIFQLQIVKGADYLENFQLKIRKERSIPATRANIRDRYGNLLAYNELAYSVTMEDVLESGSGKNAQLNATIYETLKILEKHGDDIVQEFPIFINEAGEYEFSYSGTAQLRFLADIYGYAKIDSLKYSEKTSTAKDVINYLASRSYFAIGNYDESQSTPTFVPGLGYSKEDVLKIINVRYALKANTYQKYISTKIASDISEEAVAELMENSDHLDGVHIAEDTVRRYVDGVFFSSIIGYVGKISSDELTAYKDSDKKYTSSDIVGKTGIEAAMEYTLQGTKGTETVYVDNLGRVIETESRTEPIAGDDVYLTIDKELQIATYKILEQKIAGILVSKIDNIKEYVAAEGASASKIRIAIYDVYNALFENNVIRFSTLMNADEEACAKEIYNAYLTAQEKANDKITEELLTNKIVYNKLSKEMQAYESYIVSMLMSDKVSILKKSSIDTSDKTYIAWKTDETISLYEYLTYCIAKGWIDISALDLDNQYSDTDEIYHELVNVIIELLNHDSQFTKIIFKYMIKNGSISGKQICMVLCEEGIVEVPDEKYEQLVKNQLKPYDFMLYLISNLKITPAQLALDPCSGSIVVTDVDSGAVLALVSYPGYDNNRLSNNIDNDYYSLLLSDESKPLWNYATQQTSAPGSTFKMITAAAVLEEGIINTRTEVACRGLYDTLSPTTYKCWIYPGAHGSINVSEALAKSCNYFFYEMGYKLSTINTAYNSDLGLAMLKKYADQFGLSQTSGIELPEATPSVSDAYSVVSAIGQGTNDFTTVGLARYVTTVANSGTCYDLTLIDKVVDASENVILDNKAEIINQLDYKDSTWDAIHLGMRNVITSKKYFNDFPEKVAGKTGTAQESTKRPNHALFVGYAPYDDPEIAIAVRIAFGYASDYAAETAKDVFGYYFDVEADIVNGQADQLESSGLSND